MLSVTNSGSSNRLSSGDQVNITASATPTSAPRQKPPRISTAVTARLESQAYFAEASVASVASGEGRMNFGTWKASTRTCHSTITARCTIRMIAIDLAERMLCHRSPVRSFRALPASIVDRSPSVDHAAADLARGRSEIVMPARAGHPSRRRMGMDCCRTHRARLRLARHAMTRPSSRPQRLHHQVDHVLAARPLGGGLLRSLPKIADKVGVLEKKK